MIEHHLHAEGLYLGDGPHRFAAIGGPPAAHLLLLVLTTLRQNLVRVRLRVGVRARLRVRVRVGVGIGVRVRPCANTLSLPTPHLSASAMSSSRELLMRSLISAELSSVRGFVPPSATALGQG